MAIVAEAVVSQGAGDDISGMAVDTGGDSGNTAMVFMLMSKFKICGMGGVASSACCCRADDVS